jgi:Fe-S cluster biogenesis protein NfuA
VDVAAVGATVHELGAVLRADGGDLVLVDADPGTARIQVAVVLDGVSCDDCIMPPAHLREVVDARLRAAVGEEFELVLVDPRGD